MSDTLCDLFAGYWTEFVGEIEVLVRLDPLTSEAVVIADLGDGPMLSDAVAAAITDIAQRASAGRRALEVDLSGESTKAFHPESMSDLLKFVTEGI